ncbi:MAG: hypothetical protein PVJ53_12355 [Desulfobacterales bacterium]
MTPYELARELHRDLSPVAPRLAAALNRALVEIGEGSILVGLPNGMSAGDAVSFDEREQIALQGADPAAILARITQALVLLENHSSWRVIVDKGTGNQPGRMEMLYTLFRERRGL